MPRDPERQQRIRKELQRENLDGLICVLPKHVLMATSYWPLIGASIAVVNADGELRVIVPEGEQEFARESGFAVLAYAPGSLHDLAPIEQRVAPKLSSALSELGLSRGRVGIALHGMEPATYSAQQQFGPALVDLIHEQLATLRLEDATELLNVLCSRLTSYELAQLIQACVIVEEAFEAIQSVLVLGATERDIAAELARLFSASSSARRDDRCYGFAWCMSGPNSALAKYAFAYTRSRPIQSGELVLLHCNSQVNGMWTDVTRTFVLGPLSPRCERMYESILAARDRALESIKPGVAAREVDAAARECLHERGFGDDVFPHGTGHGVGFGAISANNRPRIHPASPDVLESGMVFNVEPAIYIEGFGGVRQCEMVAVTETRAELLTPFLNSMSELVISAEAVNLRSTA
ncbi:MAG TPA: Xaa-Pro peptidase family protein [Terriglobales bacterium]